MQIKSLNMSESLEYKTIVSCAKQLEIAFSSLDRNLVHFLNQEGFITQEVCDDILNPRSTLTNREKAGELVTGIRKKVELSAPKYHSFLNYLCQRGKQYEDIVNILAKRLSEEGIIARLTCL